MTWEVPEFTTMQDYAATVHEMYQSFVDAGFTEHQALHLATGDVCCDRHEEDEDDHTDSAD